MTAGLIRTVLIAMAYATVFLTPCLAQSLDTRIVGRWICVDGRRSLTLGFNADGSVTIDIEGDGRNFSAAGTWRTGNGLVQVTTAKGSQTWRYGLTGDNRLTIQFDSQSKVLYYSRQRLSDESAGNGNQSPQVKAAYEQALQLNKKGRYEEAIQLLSRILRADPSFARAWYLRGACLFVLYNTTDYAHLDIVAERLFPEVRGKRDLVDVISRTAITDLTRSIELDPKYATAWLMRSKSRMCYREQWQAALNDCTEAIRIRPDYAYAYGDRGVIKIFLGQDSTGDFQQCYRFDPTLKPHYEETRRGALAMIARWRAMREAAARASVEALHGLTPAEYMRRKEIRDTFKFVHGRNPEPFEPGYDPNLD